MVIENVSIIHNPMAGRPETNMRVALVADRLRALGRNVRIDVTEHPGHATALALAAVADGQDFVVAAGGDGTVNEVAQALVGSATTLGVLPIGTVNIWAGESAMRWHVDRFASDLVDGTVREIDVGRCGNRFFLLMGGIGLDAAVVRAVGPALKRRFGRLAYGIALARLSRGYKGTRVRITLDGQAIETTCLMLVVSNTRRYAGRVEAAPRAFADDGLLDVTLLRGERVWNGLVQAGAIVSGKTGLSSQMRVGKARVIEVESSSPLPIQLDGDFHGFTPARFEVIPRALRVVTGAAARDLFSGTPVPRGAHGAWTHMPTYSAPDVNHDSAGALVQEVRH
jgi:diacylglycerol kinase (ATP)